VACLPVLPRWLMACYCHAPRFIYYRAVACIWPRASSLSIATKSGEGGWDAHDCARLSRFLHAVTYCPTSETALCRPA
jgi:hypothetical protein